MNANIMGLLNNTLDIVKFINENMEPIDSLVEETEAINRVLLQKVNEVNRLYTLLNEKEKQETFMILSREFSSDSLMHIYLLSILLYCVHKEDILHELLVIVLSDKLNIYQSVLIEYQIAREEFLHGSYADMYHLRRKLHSYNVLKFCKMVQQPKYIPYNDRNKNRVVIVTKQILAIKHAPTRIVLEQCYTLIKELGMEVFLVVSPTSDLNNQEILWYNMANESCIDQFDGNYIVTYDANKVYVRQEELNDDFVIIYKNVPIHGKQIKFENSRTEDLKHIIDRIYDLNPMFVYDMGSINPISDACNCFTTVVSMHMAYGNPVSDASILLTLLEKGKQDGEISKSAVMEGYNQIILKDKFIFPIDNPSNPFNRSDYKINENAFVIALVGNRLQKELTDKFKAVLKQIMKHNQNINLMIIGDFPEYISFFQDQTFDQRIYYMGYQDELADVIVMADLFLNPPRRGGGTSALISLMAGVPVLTLADGDVAGNVGPQFTAANYDELIEILELYYSDMSFYNRQKESGILLANELTDFTNSLKNNVTRIEKAILQLEGRVTSED